MWQRIQTLYLAIATGLVVALFFSVKSFTLGPGGVRAEEFTYIQFLPYLVLLILVTMLQVIALGTFKFRVFQMRTAMLAGILLVAMQLWLVVDYVVADAGVVFRWTAVFPLIAAFLDFLAAKHIFRDQMLVESIAHLRSRKKARGG